MFDDLSSNVGFGQVHRLFFSHVSLMPGWHKLVLLLGVLMALGGGVGQLVSAVAGGSDLKPGVNPTTRTIAPATSPADGGGPTYPFIGRVSPHSTGLGVSLVGGFIVGWLCRAFLKTMAMIGMLIFGVMFALSYFGVMNFDFTAARTEYANVMSWLQHQTWLVGRMIVAHLPSSGGGTVGAFLGFRRRWGAGALA